ncbi:MAG: hypothetical protein ACUVUG_00050 [Candidatus Aminicenantia bacterium]
MRVLFKSIFISLSIFIVLFFFFLGLTEKELLKKYLPFISLKEQNSFLILGSLYLLFYIFYFLRRRGRNKIDFYDILALFLLIYSTAALPRLFNLTYYAEHFVHLAHSFIHFRFDILPEGYIDDPVIFNGKIYVAFPPFPALLMIPFALIFQTDFHDFIFQIIFGSINIALFFKLIEKYLEKLSVSASSSYKIWIVFLFGLGTVHLSLLHFEGVWYVAHAIAVTLLLLSIIETLGKKRPLLIGTLWAFSVATRTHLLLAFPYFLSIILDGDFRPSTIFKRENVRKVLFLFLPVFFVLLLISAYNYIRFGNFMDMGYKKMRLNYPYSEFIKYGQFNVRFLLKNLYYLLIAPPKFQKSFPFFTPDLWGMGVLFCTSIFFILYRSFSKNLIPLYSWISIILILIPILLYYNTGGTQYGYRFIMDFIPFTAILMVHATRGKLKIYEYLLIVISIIVNLRGIFLEFIF